jgi:hypothetical protein
MTAASQGTFFSYVSIISIEIPKTNKHSQINHYSQYLFRLKWQSFVLSRDENNVIMFTKRMPDHDSTIIADLLFQANKMLS